MNFPQAISVAFQNYANFKGRSSRPEYWYFYLLIVILSIASSVGEAIGSTLLSVIFGLAYLATMIPAVAVTCRRLHDVGKSGWNQLWALTGIGAFYVLYLLIKPGHDGSNSYGDPPIA